MIIDLILDRKDGSEYVPKMYYQRGAPFREQSRLRPVCHGRYNDPDLSRR